MVKSIKQKIMGVLEGNAQEDNFAQIAQTQLRKEGFTRISVFVFYSQYYSRTQLVMVNTIAPEKELESGVILDEHGEITGFKNSSDTKSVSVDSNARYLVLDTIKDEATLLRLKSITRNQCTWIIHHIVNKDNAEVFPANLCNCHTHGMKTYTHKDFQVVLDLGDDVTDYILNSLCEKVQDGQTFLPGQTVMGIYANLPIKLWSVNEGGRSVLRALIPDDDGRFPGEKGCAAPYCDQLVKLHG